MPTTTTQYMELVLPIPTEEPGPDYAFDINEAMVQIDQHDHSVDKGTPVTPAGMNINIDLEFNDNNATELRSSRYEVQASPISGGSDLGCTYVSGVDLYYNDVNGNQIRITQSGGVAGTPGSIGNLVSPANVTYVSGSQTYVFQSSTATAGNIDCGSVTIREVLANAKGITLSSPASLVSNYTLTFPAGLPASTKFLTVDASGNIGDAYDVDNSSLQVVASVIGVKAQGITRPLLSPLGQVSSSAASVFSTSSVTLIPVTNLSKVISVSGTRPVQIVLIDENENTSNLGLISCLSGGTGDNSADIAFFRNDVQLNTQRFGNQLSGATGEVSMPLGCFNRIDTGVVSASSSYTYSVKARVLDATASLSILRTRLLVYEIG